MVKMLRSTFSHGDKYLKKQCKQPQNIIGGNDGVGVVEKVGGSCDVNVGDLVLVTGVPAPKGKVIRETNFDADFAKKVHAGTHWYSDAKEGYKFPEGDDRKYGSMQGCGSWSKLAVFDNQQVRSLGPKTEEHDSSLSGLSILGSVIGPAWSAVRKSAKLEAGDNVAIFGTDSLALTIAFMCVSMKLSKIVLVNTTDENTSLFEELGVHVIGHEGDVKAELMKLSPDGYDASFECHSFEKYGTIAIEIGHKGWGRALLLSNPESNESKISTRPF